MALTVRVWCYRQYQSNFHTVTLIDWTKPIKFLALRLSDVSRGHASGSKSGNVRTSSLCASDATAQLSKVPVPIPDGTDP